MDTAAATPCRRGHTAPRNRFGQCPECLRESRRTYNKRRPKAARPVPVPIEAPTVADVSGAPPSAPGTFLAVANEWLAGQDNSAPKTVTKRAFLLAQLQPLHDRQIASLTVPDIVRVLKDIESQRDRRESARRAGGLASQIIRYAAQHGYTPVNILPDGTLRGALKPKNVESHAAITDARPGDNHDSAPKRFGRLLDAMVTYEFTRGSKNHPSVGASLALAPHVFLRPGELRQLQGSEVDFERAELKVEAGRMKMRRTHLVPLSRQALGILRTQHATSGNGVYVFPAKARTNARKGEQCISENAWREALTFILALIREPREAMTMHGFRSIASTLLNGVLKFDSEIIELQLAHQRGGVRGIYDRSQRVEERAAMLQRWSDYIDQLRATARKEAD